ncbi:hypothetical protein GCM10009780_46500 [Actinomadura alba]
MTGHDHPAVRGVVEVIGGADGRQEGERGRREEPRQQERSRRRAPAPARRVQAEAQAEPGEQHPARDQADHEVRRGMRGQRERRAVTGQGRLHRRRPEHGRDEEASGAQADGAEPGEADPA